MQWQLGKIELPARVVPLGGRFPPKVRIATLGVTEAVLALVEGPRARRKRATKQQQATLQAVLRARWRAQRRAVLAATAGLATAFSGRPEGTTTTQQARLAVGPAIVTAWHDGGADDVPQEQEDDWHAGILAVFLIGAAMVARELGKDPLTTEETAAVATAVTSRGLTAVAQEIDRTTQDRLINAVAEVYEAGGDLAEAQQVVAETFGSFLDSRLVTVAAYELNAAYNAGRLAEARELGIGTKYWDPDGPACDDCMENANAGEIPITDDFPSGDDEPPLHPNCDCVLMFGSPE